MTAANCWVSIPENSDFSIHNIPFGIFSYQDTTKRVGSAIGEHILDVSVAAKLGLFDHLNIDTAVFKNEFLNAFIDLGKPITNAIRQIIQTELTSPSSILKNHSGVLILQKEATLHLPVCIRDYTDFYSSIEHATNVGKMFRDPENALLPNWKHIPVGYHGRASSIVVSGHDIYCLLYTSPSPRDLSTSRMPSSA